ncbi:putative butyrate kinase [Caldisphaera lagunensis DSM 15908]|uniref:Putative butyrate kinase n=1 Tax=Caldisphaera lagunensis (strain DSM 15908 / JCM 11604 / ANMR 0165 / IC-154) TaxID=1056495 RepID=L0ADH7_CALLD|nr:DUF1464 family protein [Caldisphaera lagunensis]AFZ71177.1 putative butyrate kinase [Caldisphaera lagunensis DSM 15908]
MVRAIGIDSGTMSMDLLGFDDKDNNVFLDEAIPREIITSNPEKPIEIIKSLGKVDAIVVSSGYGIPFKRAQESSDKEIELATFINKDDLERKLKIVGLRNLMKLFKSSDLPAYFVPGIIQLNTIPEYRKINRIDLGTSDKLFSAAEALRNEKVYYKKDPKESDIIVIEIGYAYTAALSILHGEIIDGIGGTSGFPGYKGMGAIDGELAYAMASSEPYFSKLRLFQGGIADYLGFDNIDKLNEISKNDKSNKALKMFIESILKDLSIMIVSNTKPERIYLSGRFTRYDNLYAYIKESIEEFLEKISIKAKVVKLMGLGKKAKEAASGAAVLANGISNGTYKDIFEALKLKESKGYIFDFILPIDLRKEIENYFSK